MQLAEQLQYHRAYLLEELNHFAELCDFLYSKELIDENEKDEILQTKSIRHDRAKCFLKILKKKTRERRSQALFYEALEHAGSSYIVKHITSNKRKLPTSTERDGKKLCTGLSGIFPSAVAISDTVTPIQCFRDLEDKESAETFDGFLSFKSNVGISENKTRYQWWYITDGTDTIRVTAFDDVIDKFSGIISKGRNYRFENFQVKKTETEYLNMDVRRTLHTVNVTAKTSSSVEEIKDETPDLVEVKHITVSEAKKVSLNERVHVKGICLSMKESNDESLLLTIADEEGKCIWVNLKGETAKAMSNRSSDSHPIILLKYGIMKENDDNKCIHVRLYSEFEVIENNRSTLKKLIKSKDTILQAFENEMNCIPEMSFDDLLNTNGDEDLHCKVKAKIFAITTTDMTFLACPDCNRQVSSTKRNKRKPYRCQFCKKNIESDLKIQYNVKMRIGYVGESQECRWATLTNKAATELFEMEPEDCRKLTDEELKEFDEFKGESFLFTIRSTKSSEEANCNIRVTNVQHK